MLPVWLKQKTLPEFTYVGIDPGLNGKLVVAELLEGREPRISFTTTEPTVEERYPGECLLLEKTTRGEDKEEKNLQRLLQIERWLQETVLQWIGAPCVVLMESLALSKYGRLAQMASLDFLLQRALWFSGLPFLSLTSKTIKRLATEQAGADKDVVSNTMSNVYHIDFSRYPKNLRLDISDAVSMAHCAKIILTCQYYQQVDCSGCRLNCKELSSRTFRGRVGGLRGAKFIEGGPASSSLRPSR